MGQTLGINQCANDIPSRAWPAHSEGPQLSVSSASLQPASTGLVGPAVIQLGNSHSMVTLTRSKHGIHKPSPHHSLLKLCKMSSGNQPWKMSF